MNWWCVQVHLLFKQREAGICSCCLLPLLLADGLKAALEILFLLVKCFSPALHVFGNLNNGKFKREHLRLDWNNIKRLRWAMFHRLWELASWYLLSSLAFGLFFFLLRLFGLFATCRCIITRSRVIVGWGWDVCLFLTVPVQILLVLRIVVILAQTQNVHVKTKLRQLGHLKTPQQWELAQYIHGCLGHSRNQFEHHNNIQRTHHIDNWLCRELSRIKKKKKHNTNILLSFIMT